MSMSTVSQTKYCGHSAIVSHAGAQSPTHRPTGRMQRRLGQSLFKLQGVEQTPASGEPALIMVRTAKAGSVGAANVQQSDYVHSWAKAREGNRAPRAAAGLRHRLLRETSRVARQLGLLPHVEAIGPHHRDLRPFDVVNLKSAD